MLLPNKPIETKMRAILVRLMAMSPDEFDSFVPKNQKEISAKALVDKTTTGDIKSLEFLMRIIGDMPNKRMESENDDELANNPLGL